MSSKPIDETPDRPRHWIPDDLWRSIQRSIPIVCVDAIPVRLTTKPDRSQTVTSVGLIRRAVPAPFGEPDGSSLTGRSGWGIVGGRMRHGATFAEELARQVRETLGPAAVVTPIDPTNPTYVAQYSPHGPDSRFDATDPRQHAIGVTWIVTLVGPLSPQGEATGFHWASPPSFPTFLMAKVTRRTNPGSPSAHASSPTLWRSRASTGSSPSISTPGSYRVSSTSRSTTSTP
ncbi:MAG: DUF4916 domain-containing protein [Proteobacteria bacterium]|nr:DUF4916 domain-containing protein [Pseudomonadota bacterium]